MGFVNLMLIILILLIVLTMLALVYLFTGNIQSRPPKNIFQTYYLLNHKNSDKLLNCNLLICFK